jgi:hypothetical protein
MPRSDGAVAECSNATGEKRRIPRCAQDLSPAVVVRSTRRHVQRQFPVELAVGKLMDNPLTPIALDQSDGDRDSQQLGDKK